MPIHPTAVVDEAASVHATAEIGPYAIVGVNVTIGARTVVGAHAVIEGPTTLGEDNRVSALAALGGPPQDLKYKGEPTTLVIGHRNSFREFCTMHRGTVTGHGTTIIGDDNLFMAYAHVAHDCVVGNRTVFANGASLAGHCVVGDDAVLGAFAGVRQFLRIGRHAFIGAFAGINHDILPFLWSSSDRDVRAWKVNSVGLERKGFSKERVAALQKAYRILHRHRHDRAAMMAALEPVAAASDDVKMLRDFIAESKQGIHGA
ncbi:MAG: acyl-ACP--UDP-N-acetylglucosamine O-acyltransferase [Acidobacteriota bacterium]|nr:acyl-ACP--UDP-N-acetylglucosamine O-acyltransferase [Acidobacteriota bacterium]